MRAGGSESCSDTPFHEKNLVSRAQERRKGQMQCSDTHFRDENPVSREKTASEDRHSCSDTLFRARNHVSRTGRKKHDGTCRIGATPYTTPHTSPYTILQKTITPDHNHTQTLQHYKHTKPIPYTIPKKTIAPDHNHTQTRQHYKHTKTHPIHHSPTHNKKLLPQNRRKSFIDLSANRLSQQRFEATRVPKREPMRQE